MSFVFTKKDFSKIKNMPHADEIIKCKKCEEDYCAVCLEHCPKCGVKDVVDAKRERFREKRRKMIKPGEGWGQSNNKTTKN